MIKRIGSYVDYPDRPTIFFNWHFDSEISLSNDQLRLISKIFSNTNHLFPHFSKQAREFLIYLALNYD